MLIHLAGDATRERALIALRFALVSLEEQHCVTLLLSGSAVLVVGDVNEPRGPTGECALAIADLVATFLDRGGSIWLLSTSAADHGINDHVLPDGAVVAPPHLILDLLADTPGSLTF